MFEAQLRKPILPLQLGNTSALKVSSRETVPGQATLPVRAFLGSRLRSSSVFITGQLANLRSPNSRRGRALVRRSVTAQLDNGQSAPAEIILPDIVKSELVSRTSSKSGFSLSAYVAGIAFAAACSLALPKAALAKDATASPPSTSTSKIHSKPLVDQTFVSKSR